MSLLTLIKAQFGKSNTPAKPLPSLEALNEVFVYSDGKLLWKIDKPNAKRKAGDEAVSVVTDARKRFHGAFANEGVSA